MNEEEKNIICFDVETTGLDFEDDEILQISIVDGNGNELLNSYVKPIKHKAWPRAQAVNGISYEIVKKAPTFKQLHKKIQQIIDKADLLVGYNINFDINFLEYSGINFKDDVPRFDVMLRFARIYGEYNEYYDGYKWQKLTTCAAYFGYDFVAHDSLEDTKATLFCYKKIIEMENR